MSLEGLDHVLWSMILTTDSGHSPAEELDAVKDEINVTVELLEDLKSRKKDIHDSLAMIEDSSHMMSQRWLPIFPESTLGEKWLQNYEVFKERRSISRSTPYERALHIIDIITHLRDARLFREGTGGTNDDDAFRNTFMEEMGDVLLYWPRFGKMLSRKMSFCDFFGKKACNPALELELS
jgi:hypothetical protein